ncbi:MAG: UDP-N-acetylmuramate--L-alanine ligase [Patescibacteria group bacterium]|nr:UDP-N-acetylmuramate--L-alanine ligase [Patescibacteria group bacterium]
MKKIKNIHFLGVKGVGMTPLAIIAKEAGFKVTGCDIDEEFITDVALKKAGIEVFKNFSDEHLKNVDLLITTGAHGGFDNPEVISAKKFGIPVWTQGQAAGEFMKGDIFKRAQDGISVTGSHGKTTTAAMIATILKVNNQDPSFLIGTGEIPSLGSPGHYGKGRYFVAEADEYATEPKYDRRAKLLWQKPKIAVITNIEFDHPDLYESADKIEEVFLEFINNMPQDGVVVCGGDDRLVKKMLSEYKGRRVTFGLSEYNDFYVQRYTISGTRMFFWVKSKGTLMGEFSVGVVGEHNAVNALGALVVALEAGFSVEQVRRGLSLFTGSKRRFEYVGKLASGASLYDDYAHHPTEIKQTLSAFRKTFPKEKIICIFQPHTYSRTKSLFEQFSSSFKDADIVILTNIYPSLREEKDETVSSGLLAESVAKFNKNVLYLPELSDVVEYIDKNSFGKDTIIISMGAGNVYKISERLNLIK